MPDISNGSSVDLLASTGLNDPNSPWNLNGLLQTGLAAGISAEQDAINNVLGQQTPLSGIPTAGNGVPNNPPTPTPVSSAVARASANWSLYLLWGAALALLAWVLFGEK